MIIQIFYHLHIIQKHIQNRAGTVLSDKDMSCAFALGIIGHHPLNINSFNMHIFILKIVTM